MLIRNTNPDDCGAPKSLPKGFAKTFEAFSIYPSPDKILVKKINGKTLGKTLKAHAEMPFNVTLKYSAGLMTMQTRTYIKKSVIKSLNFFKNTSFYLTKNFRKFIIKK